MSGDTVSVSVTLQREIDDEADAEEEGTGKVVCPRYGSEKTEAWWLVIGDSNSNALLSIKRIAIGAKASKVFTYFVHENRITFTFSLFKKNL